MKFDLFFSISQSLVDQHMPSEKQIWDHFFRQIRAADELGFKRAWVAESHLSSESQKKHKNAVIPHWKGEVGLNNDIFQLSRLVYSMTQNIEMGSAILNLLTNGGPIANAERLASFLSHQQALSDTRKIHIGFSQGRFDFMSRALGLKARNSFEKKYWKQVKSQAFSEASEIFLRLINKEEISSDDISLRYLERRHFKEEKSWQEAKELFGAKVDLEKIPINKFYEFDILKIIPQDFDTSLVELFLGSQDPNLQIKCNEIIATKVFNLSFTPGDIIDKTHQRMKQSFHKSAGQWQRSYMPRTTFVFINNDKNLNPEEQNKKAQEKASKALSAYWSAIEGTVDLDKVKNAASNALIGNADTIIEQIKQRYHPDDCLMLWFDFFNHDCDQVIHDMHSFKESVMNQFDENNWSRRVEFVQR